MQQREAGAGGEIARVVIAALILLFALSQEPIIQALFPLDVTPNLVLVIVVLWAGYHGTREGLLWAFAVGLLLELLRCAPVGPAGWHRIATNIAAACRWDRASRAHTSA